MPEKAIQASLMFDVKHQVDGSADVLKARIIDGHNKLWERWRIVRAIPKDDPQLPRHLEIWDTACDKLLALCNDLVASGYKDCLYPEGYKTEAFCLVCPKDPWTPDSCLCWEAEP